MKTANLRQARACNWLSAVSQHVLTRTYIFASRKLCCIIKILWTVTYPGSPSLLTSMRVTKSTDNSALRLNGGLASFYEVVSPWTPAVLRPTWWKQTLMKLLCTISNFQKSATEKRQSKPLSTCLCFSVLTCILWKNRQQQNCLKITCLIKWADNQWSTEDYFLIGSRYQVRSLISMHSIISKLSVSTPEGSHIHNVTFSKIRLFTSRDVSTFYIFVRIDQGFPHC